MIELTGLKRGYDFKVAWTGRGNLLKSQPGQGAASANSSVIAAGQVGNGMSVFDAFSKQLRLELTARKHPTPAVIVGDTERVPTAN